MLHVVHGFGGRNVLQDDPQRGEIGSQPDKHPVYERLLPVENVRLLIGHLTMDQKWHVDALHPLQHPVDPANVGHAGGGVRGAARRIHLDRR